MKNADASNLGVLSSFLPFIVVFLVGIFAGWWVVNRYKPCDNPITTKVPVMKSGATTNNPVKVHGEKKEEKKTTEQKSTTNVVVKVSCKKLSLGLK